MQDDSAKLVIADTTRIGKVRNRLSVAMLIHGFCQGSTRRTYCQATNNAYTIWINKWILTSSFFSASSYMLGRNSDLLVPIPFAAMVLKRGLKTLHKLHLLPHNKSKTAISKIVLCRKLTTNSVWFQTKDHSDPNHTRALT